MEETKRLHIGGLFPGVTEAELKERFSKFGTVTDVAVKSRKDSNGFNTYSKTKWKGSEMKIQLAKENFINRLEQERKQQIEGTAVENKVQKSTKTKAIVQDRLSGIPGVEKFQMKGAPPGTAIPGEQDWIVGKYGRVLPVVNVKKSGTKKLLKVDPSKLTHNLKRFTEDISMGELNVSSLTWEMEDTDSEITKKRKGEFPEVQSRKIKNLVDKSEMEKRIKEVLANSERLEKERKMKENQLEVVPLTVGSVVEQKIVDFADSDVELGNEVPELARFDSDSEVDSNQNNFSKISKQKLISMQSSAGKKGLSKNKPIEKSKIAYFHNNASENEQTIIKSPSANNQLSDKGSATFVSLETPQINVRIVKGKQKLKAFGGTKALYQNTQSKKIFDTVTKDSVVEVIKTIKKAEDMHMKQERKTPDKMPKGKTLLNMPKHMDASKNSIGLNTSKSGKSENKSSTDTGSKKKNPTTGNADSNKMLRNPDENSVSSGDTDDVILKKKLKLDIHTDQKMLAKGKQVQSWLSGQHVGYEFSAGEVAGSDQVHKSVHVGNERPWSRYKYESGDEEDEIDDFEQFAKIELRKIEMNKQKDKMPFSYQVQNTKIVFRDSERFESLHHTHEKSLLSVPKNVNENHQKKENKASIVGSSDEDDNEDDTDEEEGSKSESTVSNYDSSEDECESGFKNIIAEEMKKVISETCKSNKNLSQTKMCQPIERNVLSSASPYKRKEEVKTVTQHEMKVSNANKSLIEGTCISSDDTSYDDDSAISDTKIVFGDSERFESLQHTHEKSLLPVPTNVNENHQKKKDKASIVGSSDEDDNEDDTDEEEGSKSESTVSNYDSSEDECESGFKNIIAEEMKKVISETCKSNKNLSQTKMCHPIERNVLSSASPYKRKEEVKTMTQHEMKVSNANKSLIEGTCFSSDDTSSDDDSAISDTETKPVKQDDLQLTGLTNDIYSMKTKENTSLSLKVVKKSGIVSSGEISDDHSDSDESSKEKVLSNSSCNALVMKTVDKCDSTSSSSISEDSNEREMEIKQTSTTNNAVLKAKQAKEEQIKNVMETKKVISKTQSKSQKVESSKDSDKKRLEALKQRKIEALDQKTAIQKALASTDKGVFTNKKIVFDSDDSEEELTTRTVSMETSDTPIKPVPDKSSRLFESSSSGEDSNTSTDDDDDDDIARFNIKQQFEGSAGRKLASLQSQFGNDERFKLDARFAEPDSENEGAAANDTGDVEGERVRSLQILQSIVGVKNVKAVSRQARLKATFRDIATLKYDPSKEEHKGFEMKMEPKKDKAADSLKSPNDESEAKESAEAQPSEEPMPEVGKEKFYEISESLKEAFAPRSQERTGSAGFSLLAAFGRVKDSEDEDSNKGHDFEGNGLSVEIPSILRTDQLSLESRFKVDEEDSGEENEEEYIDDDEETLVAAPQPRPTDTKSVESMDVDRTKDATKPITPSTFFFAAGDQRLKDGAMFYRRDDLDTLREKWLQKRPTLVENYKSKHKNFRRKHADHKKNKPQIYKKKR
ncbi:nucleolar protein 8-like isoform X2 [Dreissena polymorpha]|uniref:nucleolar protein 8-like isoform X2 n=1 Tax=Dreissena polymorpha TaxID=45954 RepID=UPI002264432A|nr:nucleolar protein 8-like isoform X2 [Dreissena polymorpha]